MAQNGNWLDRAILAVAPKRGMERIRARAVANMLRNYEAANVGRRTQNWTRRTTDANGAVGPALVSLRAHSRDLARNNAWARNALRTITRNVVGWGIVAKPVGGPEAARIREAWNTWANSTQCDAAGRLTFSGLQKLALKTTAEAGEVLARRRWRRLEDGLAIPLQIQMLEPDHLDTDKDGVRGVQGGPIIRGVEFDAIGRRVAYWLFDEHPGSTRATSPVSRRIPASEIIHHYDVERAGQDRGVPWLASAILNLKDFDEFEDAQLMRQKIAACFAVLTTDVDGPTALGEQSATDPLVETVEPGMVLNLPPGKTVTTANPPTVTDDGFSTRTLRRIAASIGVTYEDLTGDYSQVNFSSARMSRIAHWGNVHDWTWNMFVPQFCDPVWSWAMQAAIVGGLIEKAPRAEWTPQPMPMTDPDKEARANVLMVRSGQKTLSQVIREQGGDPDTHLAELAKDMKKLASLGLVLDCDPSQVTQSGQKQQEPQPEPEAPPEEKEPEEGEDEKVEE